MRVLFHLFAGSILTAVFSTPTFADTSGKGAVQMTEDELMQSREFRRDAHEKRMQRRDTKLEQSRAKRKAEREKRKWKRDAERHKHKARMKQNRDKARRAAER